MKVYFSSCEAKEKIDQLNNLIANSAENVKRLKADERFNRIAQWICFGLGLSVGLLGTAGFFLTASPVVLGIGVLGGIACAVYGVYLHQAAAVSLALSQAFEYLLSGDYLHAAPILKSMLNAECSAPPMESVLKPQIQNGYRRLLAKSDEYDPSSFPKQILNFERVIGILLMASVYQSIKTSTQVADLDAWREHTKIAQALCTRSEAGILNPQQAFVDLVLLKNWQEIKAEICPANPPIPKGPHQDPPRLQPPAQAAPSVAVEPARSPIPKGPTHQDPPRLQPPAQAKPLAAVELNSDWKKNYKLNPDYIRKPFISRGEVLRKTQAFDKMNLQEIHKQCKQSPHYLGLPQDQQEKFSRFIDNIYNKKIPRDKESLRLLNSPTTLIKH